MPAQANGSLTTSTDTATFRIQQTDTVAFITVSGTFTGESFTITGALDGVTFGAVTVIPYSTSIQQTNNTCTPADNTTTIYKVPCQGLSAIKLTNTAQSTGPMAWFGTSMATAAPPFISTTNALVQTFPGSGTIGASTAAAGTTTSDAGALPAGTAKIYPTTAANGTKGVVISTADQVTGNTIFIGNGVSNQILKIYPPSGGTINGAAADAALSTGSGKGCLVTCLSGSGNTWLAT